MIIIKKMGFKHFDTTVTISFLMILNLTVAYGQFLNNKPWPTYSLQNMPKTGFSCRDKILGGYYADSETQCQMFHVCVKVAGVGVQDFRFLCPNGTAFDQEAQICADWGDVDCEQATLYYSSDNFDLYRIGSGFESKRAPLAEEDEATFHLQRAETSDVRRSKQTVVNQSARPEQPSPIYQHNTERNYQQQQQQQKQSYNNDQFQYQSTKKLREPTIQKPTTTKKPYYQKPVDNQYSNVNSGKNYNSNNNQNDYQSDSRNDDELLKGSQSSNFFNNRNNGKEDDLVDFTKSPSAANIKRPNQRGRQRINRNQSRQNDYSANRNNIPTPPSKTTTTFAYQQPEKEQQQQQQKSQKVVKNNSKTLTLQSSYRTAELHQYDLQPNYRNTTVTPLITSTTTQRYNNFTPTKPQTQQNIQPTTYNPSYNPYRTKSTLNYEDYKTQKPYTSTQSQNNNENPFYNVQYEKAAEGNPDQYNRFSSNDDFSKHQTTTQNYNNFVQQRTTNNFGKYETDTKQQSHSTVDVQQHNIQPLIRRNDDQFSRQTSSKATTIKQNFENNNNNYQVPLTVRPLEAKRVNAGLTNQTHNNQNAIQNQNNVFNHQPHDTQSNHRAIPTPVSKPTTNTNSFQQSTFSSPTPRGFSHETTRISSPSSTGSFQQQQSISNTNNRQQKISRSNENFTPSTTLKKFSTLVPKDQYFPTTFKPALYKKNGYNSIKTEKPRTNNFAAASYLPTTSTTTTSSPPRTSDPDEDDGQYHPELYEKDFPRNKIQTNKSRQRVTRPDYQQASTRQQTYHQTPSPAGLPADFGDEDEFLKPAHSLNIAYGANQLRNEKAEKAKQEQSSLKTSLVHKTSTVSTIRTTKTTTTAATTSRSQPSPLAAGKNQKSKKPKPHDDDTSYDYAYYDTGSDNPHDYAEYDVISEFGKTKNRKHK